MKERAIEKSPWPIESRDGLTLLFSPRLLQETLLTHAFTTRLGGTSKPPLNWFNLGRHWTGQESKLDADANRKRLCQVLQLNESRLVVAGQVHSSRVDWVTRVESPGDVDGLATALPQTPLLVHYADCVPVIIFERKLAAVCVVHAGWRGTAGGIASAAVSLLRQKLGASPENMLAAVGPAIGPCCYPVGEDVALKLKASVGCPRGLMENRQGKMHPDLQAFNAVQLLEAGVGAVDVSAYCTACHSELFYSHRQSGGATGRQGAIACLRAQ